MDGVLWGVLIISGYTDWRYRKIYNKVLLPAALAAFAYHFATAGWRGLIYSGQGLVVGLALLMIPFLWGGIGAGDVKLLAVIGALKGAGFACWTFLAGAIAGGIMAVFFLLSNKRFYSTLSCLHRRIQTTVLSGFREFDALRYQKDEKNICIPYGIALALGAVAASWMV